MKAAVVHAYDQPLTIEDVPIPEPGAEQVLVRIEASGLCRTDIHAARGEWPMKPALPFGRTRVLRAERPLEDVKATFEAVLDGSAPAPRMVFDVLAAPSPA